MDEQVEFYVDAILGSKMSNIPGLPGFDSYFLTCMTPFYTSWRTDWFERTLYKNVIKLVLTAIDNGIGMVSTYFDVLCYHAR